MPQHEMSMSLSVVTTIRKICSKTTLDRCQFCIKTPHARMHKTKLTYGAQDKRGSDSMQKKSSISEIILQPREFIVFKFIDVKRRASKSEICMHVF